MKVLLARVGIDTRAGGWNAPVDPRTGWFSWVPFPEDDRVRSLPRYVTTYEAVDAAICRYRIDWGVSVPGVPQRLLRSPMHLDPDFEHCTYGDITASPRGRQFQKLDPGDFIAFYSGLAPINGAGRLYYALIGCLRVTEVVKASDVEVDRMHENAHTKLATRDRTHIVVRGDPEQSGRFTSALEIGTWRDGAYRVLPEIFRAWGGFTSKSDSIQRGVRWLADPGRFMQWFEKYQPPLVRSNW